MKIEIDMDISDIIGKWIDQKGYNSEIHKLFILLMKHHKELEDNELFAIFEFINLIKVRLLVAKDLIQNEEIEIFRDDFFNRINRIKNDKR